MRGHASVTLRRTALLHYAPRVAGGGPCGSAGASGTGARPAWADEQANRVAGFEPWQLRPGLSDGDSAPVWLRQLYRGVQVVNAPGWGAGGGPAGSAARKGIAGLRFTLDPTLLLPANQGPANTGFWQTGTPAGVANVSNCAAAQPLFVTKPLFLDGNASLRAAVDGVPPPMPILHETWYDIEPETGAALTVRERMQLNAYVQLTNGSRLFLPLLWYDKHGQISDGGAAALRAGIADRRAAASMLQLALSVASALTGVAGIILAGTGARRSRAARLQLYVAGDDRRRGLLDATVAAAFVEMSAQLALTRPEPASVLQVLPDAVGSELRAAPTGSEPAGCDAAASSGPSGVAAGGSARTAPAMAGS